MLSLFCMISIGASAEIYFGSCGDNANWSFDTTTGLLSITGSGKMTDYDYAMSSNAPWYRYRSDIKSLSIGDQITSIGNRTFRTCINLTSVIIPNSVTKIGNDAFYDCSGLTSVVIGNSVTEISKYAFVGCNNVKKLIYAEGTKTVLRTYLTSITSVTIPNSVTWIEGGTFYGCSCLTSVTIPNSVIEIGSYAFRDCSGLASVNITDLDKWAEIEFGDSDANPLYYAHNLYLNGQLVTDAKLTTTKKIRDYAFYDCSGLTSVTIPNSVTKIGGSAFSGCSGLRSVYVGWKDADKIPSITANDFDFSHSCELYVPIGTSTIYQLQNYWRWFDILEYLPEEEAYLTIMGVYGVILQQAVETGKTYKYLLDNKKNGKIVSVTFNGEDVTADVTDGKYTTPKITGNSEIYVEYDNQPLGDTNLDGKVNVNDITRTAEIILLRAKAEMEADRF